jgi:heterodisulfide reductase subunit B
MKICFYPGCSFATSAGYKESTEAVCRKLGIELNEIPDWNCCGATVMFGENKLRALALAARHFALVQAMGFEDLVTGCNACYATLRKAARLLTEDQDLFRKTREILQNLGLELDRIPQVRHLLEVLVEVMPDSSSDKYKTLAVGAYYGCQLTRPNQDLDKGEHPEILEHFLDRIGFAVKEHSASTQCCGASHAVIYKNECQGLSHRIIREIGNKGAQVIATICPLCQFNLDQAQTQGNGPGLPVTYFTQLAGLALGLAPSELGLNKLLVSADKVLTRP